MLCLKLRFQAHAEASEVLCFSAVALGNLTIEKQLQCTNMKQHSRPPPHATQPHACILPLLSASKRSAMSGHGALGAAAWAVGHRRRPAGDDADEDADADAGSAARSQPCRKAPRLFYLGGLHAGEVSGLPRGQMSSGRGSGNGRGGGNGGRDHGAASGRAPLTPLAPPVGGLGGGSAINGGADKEVTVTLRPRRAAVLRGDPTGDEAAAAATPTVMTTATTSAVAIAAAVSTSGGASGVSGGAAPISWSLAWGDAPPLAALLGLAASLALAWAVAVLLGLLAPDRAAAPLSAVRFLLAPPSRRLAAAASTAAASAAAAAAAATASYASAAASAASASAASAASACPAAVAAAGGDAFGAAAVVCAAALEQATESAGAAARAAEAAEAAEAAMAVVPPWMALAVSLVSLAVLLVGPAPLTNALAARRRRRTASSQAASSQAASSPVAPAPSLSGRWLSSGGPQLPLTDVPLGTVAAINLLANSAPVREKGLKILQCVLMLRLLFVHSPLCRPRSTITIISH